MEEIRTPSFWAVIPASVRYDADLSSTAKLLYAEITAMSDATGFCWASNSYLAKLFDISIRTVTRITTQLEERGLVTLEIVRGPKGNITERRIWVSPAAVKARGGIDKNVHTPMDKNVYTGIDKNVHKNSTSNNTIPPIVPQGGRRVRIEHKDAPEWQPDRFVKLWQFYPHDKRGNKQRAIRAWEQLHPAPELIDTMAAALARQMKTEAWTEGIGIPHVSTWLNNYGWEGFEPEAAGAGETGIEIPEEWRETAWL